MRALFDVSCLDHERISGVGTYARHLAYALTQVPKLDVVGSYRFSRQHKLNIIQRHWMGPVRPYIPVWSAFDCRDFAVFHGPDFRVPLVRGPARVVTIHDLAYYDPGHTEERFARKKIALTEKLLGRKPPDAVIAVSHFTKHEIVKRFPKIADRVHAVWHGADHLLIPANKGSRPLPEPYFLFVGNLEARKNVAGLIRAFTILKQRPEHAYTRLVLVGKAGFGIDEVLNAAKKSAARDHIVLPGFISNIGLVNYYQWAEAFVYPSLYEGFGFPVLEAMRLGCPVITSNVSATPEVADNAALLVNPH
ncbi:MAG: glycosyltransferase family 4 protein, partial [Bdellovibrionales bacterium]